MKKFIALGAILLSMFVLTGCGQKQADNDLNTDLNPELNQNDDQNDQTDTQTKKIVYTDSTYGFSLTFPQAWKDYTTTKEAANWTKVSPKGEALDETMITTVYFGLPAQAKLFSISMFTEVQWNKIQSLCLPGVPKTALGKNSKYVFALNGSSAAPVNKEITARMQEITSIGKTFSVPGLIAVGERPKIAGWQTYTNEQYGFQIQYPAKYKTAVDTYGWPNSVVNFIEKNGGQAYRAVISVWDSNKMSDIYKSMRSTTHKIDDKYIVLSYYADDDPSGEWQDVECTFEEIK